MRVPRRLVRTALMAASRKNGGEIRNLKFCPEYIKPLVQLTKNLRSCLIFKWSYC